MGFWSLMAQAKTVVALNLFDAGSTHIALGTGVGYEVNPVMAWAFKTNPWLFWILKMGLVLFALGIMDIANITDQERSTVLIVVNSLYAMLVVYHLAMWSYVLLCLAG